jgi:MutS domain V
MKAHLMFRDRDFDPKAPLPAQAPALVKDLELEVPFAAMAGGDPFVLEIARRAVLTGVDTPEGIRHRQEILRDCLEHPDIVRQTYALAVEALERERKIWGWSTLRTSPEGTLYRSREVLGIFFEVLKRLRHVAEQHAARFRSEGFTALFRLLVTELSDSFLAEVEDHLRQLSFRDCLLMSARLGSANEGIDYVLRKPAAKQRWWERLQEWGAGPLRKESPSYTYEIPERDENGARALGDLRGRGVAQVAAALGESTDHLLAFFGMLRTELAFFIGALNLRDRLSVNGVDICFPDPLPIDAAKLTTRKLRDVSLSLSVQETVVGNDVDADDKLLVVITGANRGGKSTFLRSVGQAQLMMQCGLFVCATSFRANLCSSLFTHYKREEDASMKSGKLDEELARMSAIVDYVRPHSVILCNESFGSTNEREGSEIARQIVAALLERNIKVLYVTHMYELAHRLWLQEQETHLFLRAERLPDGRRTFRMEEGRPLATSYGQDLFRRIFASAPVTGREVQATPS